MMLSFHGIIGKFSRQKITKSPDKCALRLSAFIPITALPHPFPFPPPLPPPPPQIWAKFFWEHHGAYTMKHCIRTKIFLYLTESFP